MKKFETGVSRRSFLAGSLGTGLIMGLGVVLPGCSGEDVASEMSATGGSQQFSPVVWFEIDEAGQVLVNIAKAEMGQHVGTALARIVAEELGADWESVSLEHVDSDPKWGYMVTGGSWSVVTSFEMLSRAGAAGRTVLIDAAAKLLGVDASELSAAKGVVSGAGQSLSFAEIVSRGDISRSFSDEELAALPIKPPSARTLIGKATNALDVPAKSRGDAVYGLDAELPGMVYAHPIVAPTRYGSVVKSVDDSAAKAIAGYQQTLTIEDPSGFVQGMALVIADSFPAAMKATEAVKVEWDAGDTASVSEEDILAEGQSLVDDPESGVLFVNAGDADAAISAASDTLSSTYRTSTALHFTLEPQNALVEFRDGQCHVHAGNQWQSLIIPVLAQSLDMEEKDIVLHTYYLGGGFGRRLFGDQMIPAAHAARTLGKPVKLIMTRPVDSLFDCARSPSVARLDAAFAEDGSLSAIDHAAAAGWPTLSMAPGFLGEAVDGEGKFDGFSINGADHWYSLPNHRVRAINNKLAQDTFLPGWLRAVGPGWIGWGVESFMDEIAHKLGMDPLEYRLSLLDAEGRQAGSGPKQVGGASRLAAVLKDVQRRSNWGASLPEGEALGVAVAHGQERAMPTWSACVAHVAVKGKDVTVKKLWQTLDCGTVVHPDGALAQAEGATLWGLSLALHEGTAFENGQVRDRNLDSYTPLRMEDVPEMDIKFMDSDEFPMGLGEPPLIAVAPAIGNAIFAATGQRVRDLPIRL
ncbi:xanthine dehydrogenase family protein molybdopterin-binding subunit [Congregibacter litoralis]|uniref:Aerobic-type carbon monoxide dehydrogenase, large subunit CoxL/CutL-like protein n=1 Tax=Congregibacter litoralis KT71 TaxID=314285 RepID=A4A782_9GAMM|nr:molybdopterin cofactor-binding domain-containing protein [Congregibacter litoralis]EAQ98151.1 Aerobic-type carbon monoxide dehydrogenase, large subunit CoxL/CutL-like protein [Congregibacter litoralis KT71]